MSVSVSCPHCHSVLVVPIHRDTAHAQCAMCRSIYYLVMREVSGPANNLKLEGERVVPVRG